MPTIDYYLSSEMMEPDDGQLHYTEQLVRLPHISIHYTPPDYGFSSLSRNDLGLREDALLYCCAQALFKYLPQFDFIFPRIARRLDDAQFVFFSSPKSSGVTEKFMQRIARELERAGLDAARHVVMMPHLPGVRFHATVQVCDVFLDTVEWSGCNTTMEALACGVPVITCRGSMMRGRHTYAFLKMMGLDDLIAGDVDSYVELAVGLGKDESRRHRIRAEIPVRLPRLYRDLTAVHGLERFLVDAVAASRTVSASPPARHRS